jgi:hypothetical protein
VGRRRPDPRVTTSAIPPVARTRGTNPNTALRIKCAEERCTKCKGTGILTSQTVQTSTGVRIVRFCKTCMFPYIAPNPPTVPTKYGDRLPAGRHTPDYKPPAIMQRVDTLDPTLPPRRRAW